MPIPVVDIEGLFGEACGARDIADAAVYRAATQTGFMTIRGLPPALAPSLPMRRQLLRLFTLSEFEKRKLLRRSFDPARPNVYRGYFPLQQGVPTFKEGIDMGPDVAHAGVVPDPSDPLTEATPMPDETALPGWRAAVRDTYIGMEAIGATIMQSLARSLELPEDTFAAAFAGGISTLRLIRYPVRGAAGEIDPPGGPALQVEHNSRRRVMAGAAHVDSGFVTLLAQDGVEGLQAKAADGAWIDVPPIDGTMAVNFGGLLERWTGGRIKATEHRVLSPGRERFSIPFFYEPRVDAIIRPLPGGAPFAPFSYGDHLWSAMTGFVEFRSLAGMRAPRGIPTETA